MAVGTGSTGWKQPMMDMLGFFLLSSGRLDGSGQAKKNEQG
jgi:hypothetical protein